MNISVEVIPSTHEHEGGFVAPQAADAATHDAHLGFQDAVERLQAGPDTIKGWHTTIDPLNSTPSPCMHELVTRRETLTSGAMLMIAHSLGYDGRSGVRNFFGARGILKKHSVSVNTSELPRELIYAEAPVLSAVIAEEFKNASEGGVARQHIPHLYYAAELALDNSQLPLHDYLQTFNMDRLIAYANAEPTTSNASFRKAAYEGLHAVTENISKLEDTSVDEDILALTAAQHLLAMQHLDWNGYLFMNRFNFPELMTSPRTFKEWAETDVVSILKGNTPALYNTGYSTVDQNVIQPWKIESAVEADLADSIKRIIDIVKNPNGLAAKLSKRQYAGLVHESMWLVDAVMLATVFDIQDVCFFRALTREDRNYMVNKPELKRTFDIRVTRFMTEQSELIQLKSSDRSAQRGAYESGIKVVVEQGFNDTHPGRLANKLKTYLAILNGELPEHQAKQMMQRLALKSTVRTLLAR